jgi:hypothetical protein
MCESWLQGSAFEAQCIAKGMGAAWTAPAHMERLQSEEAEERLPCGHILAARLWARIAQHTKGQRNSTDGGAGRPLTEAARSLQHYLKCAL